VSGAFEFYRFRRLSFRILPRAAPGVNYAATAVGDLILAYLPEESTVTPSFANLSEQTFAVVLPAATLNGVTVTAAPTQTIPTAWMTVPSKVLNNQGPKWYKTAGATTEDLETLQGQLILATTGSTDTDNAIIEITYDVDFCGAEKSTLQP